MECRARVAAVSRPMRTMKGFGIHTRAQFMRMSPERRFSGARVAYNLLDIGDHPSAEEIRVFEDVSFTLRTSNGTFRTSFRNRFRDVDAPAIRRMQELWPADALLAVEDRAVSHGLTSCEWAEKLFAAFRAATFEASDLLTNLLELRLETGETYITEPDGTPLQYIKPPWVVSVRERESWRNPLLRAVAARARKRFERLSLPAGWVETAGGAGFRVRRISCIHPEAVSLSLANKHFQFRKRSVFDRTTEPVHVIRTMNIFNNAYFSEERLREGAAAVFDSIQAGGLWIVGRTLEEDLSNHVSILRRRDINWEILDRVGAGWEMEHLALGARERA
jgi:hypothetical protein